MTPCSGRRCANAYRRLVEQGWTDALRALHPDERIYTFWNYFRNAFARDAGLRIDHLLLSPSLAGRLVAAGVDRDARARDHASDHAPVWIELSDANARSPRTAPRRRKERSGGRSVRRRREGGRGNPFFARNTHAGRAVFPHIELAHTPA